MSTRPLYSTAMLGLAVCFIGYRKSENKKELRRLLFLIHSMGGRVMSDETKVTHLVAKHLRDEKYQYAATFDVPVVKDGWIVSAWERRGEVGFKSSEPGFQDGWRVKPFHGARVHFLGFTDEERAHMAAELERNGGRECRDYKTDPCTHVVVESVGVRAMPPDARAETAVVRAEWFWQSIQMDACASENEHLFAKTLESFLSPRPSYFSPGGHPGSHGRRKKRRTEAVRQLAQGGDGVGLSTTKKARSSLGELRAVETVGAAGSFVLDTPDKNSSSSGARDNTPLSPAGAPGSPRQQAAAAAGQQQADLKSLTPRQQIFHELVQTEENYVNILRTVVEVFKEPLEDPKMPLLNQQQMKIIFGNVPPILEVHAKMLDDFGRALEAWDEGSTCVGDIVQRYTQVMLKVYPPFVNFFENTKQTLERCDKENPRFHAFLKVGV